MPPIDSPHNRFMTPPGPLSTVLRDRLEGDAAGSAVAGNLIGNYRFGQGLFHKILTRTVLKPGSIQPPKS